MIRRLVLVAAALACGGPAIDSSPTLPRGDPGLVGTWDASMLLTQPYQLEPEDPPRRRICGAIGFIEASDPMSGSEATGPLVGVYSLDLSGLGLRWRDDFGAPIASAEAEASDSLTISLKGGNNETIVLRGLRAVDEIRGTWTAQSTRGDARGFFEMRRRGAGTASLCDVTPPGSRGCRESPCSVPLSGR